MREVRLIGEALTSVQPGERDALIARLAKDTGERLRLFDASGRLIGDSRALGVRNFVLRDPDKQGLGQVIARFLDAGIDTVVGAARPPLYRERRGGAEWPDVMAARRGTIAASVWRAPDRTPVITAAAPLPAGGAIMTTENARFITETVRIERFRLSVLLALVALISVLLSLFWHAPSSAPCGVLHGQRCAFAWAARARWWCPACPTVATNSACSPARCRI